MYEPPTFYINESQLERVAELLEKDVEDLRAELTTQRNWVIVESID